MDREQQCDQLTKEVVKFMLSKLDGYQGTGLRGTNDIEFEINVWLDEYAIFKHDAE